ncbi:MAG: cobalt ECF transporter T component CbiQ [Candidatus Omnitrophica bacterium]|nr:cobalt ECF transporter T component CbiQ [Candidatus Omnitrophota bacterium]MDD5351981.1 cobalt ECF transporter T component CbiQ [Candidatus Omnitrophota bacterium]MDD5551035.1 cobalt ECF transporter T component CbiQ [Candidatus Omnitrophota bacterium]
MKKNNFIERSISGAVSFLKESIFADEYASKNGFLQSLDPRIKTLTFLMFIMAILFTKSIAILLCLYAACLVLALFSKINIGFFLKRTWIFIPLFSLFIAIPALFSIFTPGQTILTINIIGAKLIITRQGLSSASLFVTRVVTSVSFAVLLNVTTRHFELLRVLRIFKVPQIFVMTLGMCYRYIYLFLEIVENTYLAIKSRVGSRLHYKKGQEIVAWNISSLWQRSYYLNEAVYNAMLSRGYSGEPVLLNDFKIKSKDWAWLFSITLFFVIIILGGKII